MSTNDSALAPVTGDSSILPTRRLPAGALAVFKKVQTDFIHLQSSDAEQLTQYAEAATRYQNAQKETRKRPTISTPIVNRATGNVTGEKITRNPAWLTLKEAQQQMNTLARRLMIDATSADKRQRLLTKAARALGALERGDAAKKAALDNLTEYQIQERMAKLRTIGFYTEAALRMEAIWQLTVYEPLMNEPGDDHLDLYAPLPD